MKAKRLDCGCPFSSTSYSSFLFLLVGVGHFLCLFVLVVALLREVVEEGYGISSFFCFRHIPDLRPLRLADGCHSRISQVLLKAEPVVAWVFWLAVVKA